MEGLEIGSKRKRYFGADGAEAKKLSVERTYITRNFTNIINDISKDNTLIKHVNAVETSSWKGGGEFIALQRNKLLNIPILGFSNARISYLEGKVDQLETEVSRLREELHGKTQKVVDRDIHTYFGENGLVGYYDEYYDKLPKNAMRRAARVSLSLKILRAIERTIANDITSKKNVVASANAGRLTVALQKNH